jgi:hypothetical protein
MDDLSRHIRATVPIILGTVIFLFFFLCAPGMIWFREQNHLFFYTKEFFLDHVTHPGGLATYAGAFLTQFYTFRWAGALIHAGLIVLVQQSINKLLIISGIKNSCGVLSLIPAVLIWFFSCDPNYMTGALVALLISLYSVQLTVKIRHQNTYMVRIAILAVLLYVTVGGSFLLYLAFILGFELFSQDKNLKKRRQIFLTTEILLLATGLPLTAAIFSPYPLEHLFLGIGFYRYPGEKFYFQYVPWLVMLITVIPAGKIPVIKKPGLRSVTNLLSLLLIVGIGFLSACKAVNPAMEESLEYDHMAWNQQWDKIIRQANKKGPSTSMSMACLNLALVKTGKSGDQLFNYFQNGTKGLIPEFGGDFTSPLTTAEIFYHLGLINEAQHYVFEAMEAIPNHRKSARCLMRLAQTNLINKQYDVAQKYLGLLHKTLFYRHWSQNATFENHPEWINLQEYRLREDKIFGSSNMSTLLKDLTVKNPDNKTAFQYLMAYTLLNKEWEKAAEHYELGQQYYTVIPWAYQQALAFEWFQRTGNLNQIPFELDLRIQQGISEFMKTMTLSSEKQARAILEKPFGHTYWYYLYFIF